MDALVHVGIPELPGVAEVHDGGGTREDLFGLSELPFARHANYVRSGLERVTALCLNILREENTRFGGS